MTRHAGSGSSNGVSAADDEREREGKIKSKIFFFYLTSYLRNFKFQWISQPM